MDCLASCGKCFLTLINTLFGLIGLACLVIGLIIKFGKDVLNDVLNTVMDQIGDQIKPMLTATGSSIDSFKDSFDLTVLLGDVAIFLIVFGVVLLSLVIVGYCGTCCMSRCLLIIYGVILIILVLGQIIGLILLFASRDTLSDQIKSPLKDSLTDYKGDQALDFVSVAWNAVMLQMSCCGVDTYKDFDVASKWGKSYTDGATTINGLATPLVCCTETARQNLGNSGSVTAILDCAKSPLSSDNNYQNGCYDAVWDEIDKSKPTVIGIMSAIIAFQALMIFFSLWLARAIRKESQTGPIG
ncbi:tetraspanin-9-like [Ylistrum balloti]|uniref:tetraspanin-9-like n=1 Tax=Ylistrum balloti TaxID=509963 RepID=UPI0029058B72|nr:tetraspanin-9-like [Ylistrum balloti]